MLRVLAASDRTEEYLRLSKAARAHATHASMLVKLNRPQEAMDYAARYFKAPSEAHELAKALREAGDDARALDIAEAGLALVGAAESEEPRAFGALGARGQFALAHWLRDYAGAMGKTKLALTAAVAAFTETCSLEEFRAAEKWAGKSWSRVRRELLARLGAARYARDRTEIYLQEGLIDEAVRSAGEPSEYGSKDDVLMRLAEAAHASHADWVIRFATRKAAYIMDNNRAPDYPYAA
jgi:uncharacterized Zn finger protein